MKGLPLEFKKNGYNYLQLWRDEDYAIYQQSDDDQFIAYEVFRINKNDDHEIAGNIILASESVPPSTSWGKGAYTVSSFVLAIEKVAYMKDRAIEYARN